MNLIFDIGSNNGDDIPYYLMKAEKVIAFEANPVLANEIALRFSEPIQSGVLQVENRLLVAENDKSAADLCFYVHKRNHVLSQFPKPSKETLNHFNTVLVGNVSVQEAIHTYGEPSYAKIDVEHYDYSILSEFFRLGHFPNYISTEIHSKRVASLLLKCPRYSAYKLLEGKDVSSYDNSIITDRFGNKRYYSFPHHAAGPFGDDIIGNWSDQKSIRSKILSSRLGWKDLHASALDDGIKVEHQTNCVDHLLYHYNGFKPYVPELIKSAYRALRLR